MERPPTSGKLSFPDAPKLELDQLIDQLVERATEVKRVQGRLRALLRGVELMTSELSLDAVLTNIVEAARDLSGAEYGGLGVISPDGGLERFLHVGVPPEIVEAIGRQPEGKGLIGALITDPHTIRTAEPTNDPRAVGFPEGHPLMKSFLGVPIHVRDTVFGNLYLGNAPRGEFTVEDEELITALALAAGSAISNARLYQESRMQQRWLQATADLGTMLLTEPDTEPLQVIADRTLDVADADLVAVALVSDDRREVVIEAAAGRGASQVRGYRLPMTGTLFGQMLVTGEPVTLPDAATHFGAAELAPGLFEAGPALVLPLVSTGDVRGAICIIRMRGGARFQESERGMAVGFASHASIALELSDSRGTEQRLLLLEDRDRIAMDLHDHVIQELFAIGLGLESTATTLGMEHPVSERLVKRVDDVDRVIKRIRTSIFELRGAVIGSHEGLRQRLLALAAELKPALGFAPAVTFSGTLDTLLDATFVDDVTACVRESLTNVAKHARARSAGVEVAIADGVLTVQVRDDGIGPDGAALRSSGTANLRSRAQRHGGDYVIEALPEGGTIVTWTALLE